MEALPLGMFLSVVANDTLRYMNSSVDRCDNFYQYVCGNYANEQPLSPGEPLTNVLKLIGDRELPKLIAILEQPFNSTDPPSVRLVKDFYNSCMDLDAVNNADVTPFKNLVALLGGWPIIDGDKRVSDQNNWIQLEAILFYKFGFSTIMETRSSTNMEDPSKSILSFDQPELGMAHRDHYLDKSNSKIADAYRRYILNASLELGADKDTIDKEIDALIEFETKLANISSSSLNRINHDDYTKQMTISVLLETFSELNFKTFIEMLGKYGWKYTNDMKVSVTNVEYFKSLHSVIESTSKRTIKNFQLWTVFMYFVNGLSSRLIDASRDYSAVETGRPNVGVNRNATCQASVERHFLQTLSYLYANSYFDKDAKRKLDDLVANLRKVMKENLDKVSWMDEHTRSVALRKLEVMEANVGYPTYVMNESFRSKNLEWLNFTNRGYFDNLLSLAGTNFNATIRKLNEPVDRGYWQIGAFEVNAGADLIRNTILFPAAILQYPLFHGNMPTVMNFGRMGYAIGHEITHHFDDEGRQFGINGELYPWWTNNTLESYKNKTKCFENQYNSTHLEEVNMNVNGKTTLGENIGDNGGLRIAFQAFRSWAMTHDETETIPEGLKQFTTEQLFFIAFGQTWCENYRKDALKHHLLTDPHSPGEPRINVPLQNYDEFAKAFHCPEGSRMNPKSKCQIW